MKTNELSIILARRPAFLSVVAAFALLLFSACQPNRQENKAEEVIINGLSDTEWSYFSFESGTVVGRSELNNKEQDAQWASRKDWDIAICGDYIKTNSGTSGNGFAGAQINTTSTYDALTEAPADGYLIDTLYLDR